MHKDREWIVDSRIFANNPFFDNLICLLWDKAKLIQDHNSATQMMIRQPIVRLLKSQTLLH
jgi:hypothetical protein